MLIDDLINNKFKYISSSLLGNLIKNEKTNHIFKFFITKRGVRLPPISQTQQIIPGYRCLYCHFRDR